MFGFHAGAEINARLDHPLVGGSLARAGIEPAFELAVPVPAISEIPAGFDAIFQFTTPVLSQYVRKIVGRTAWTLVSYDTTNLSGATKQEILNRLRAALELPTPTSTSGGPLIIIVGGTPPGESGTPKLTELPNPLALRVTAHGPSIDLALPGAAFDAGVEWAIDIEVGVPESPPPDGFGPPAFSVGSRADVNLAVAGAGTGNIGVSTPGGTVATGGGTTLRFVPLTQGAADTEAKVKVETSAPQYQAWARLDFSGTNINLHPSGDQLFGDLLQDEINQQLSGGIVGALNIAFGHPNLSITPHMALGGVLWANENLAGVQSFRVRHTTGFGNRPARRVLSLCINVGPSNVNGDRALVRPFVDDKSFAYYLSASIVQAVLQVRWSRPQVRFPVTAHVPLDMELSNNPGTIIQGRGRVQFRLIDVTDIVFDVTTVDLPDAILLSGSAEITLLEAWDDQNQKIQDLGTYADPAVTPFAWRVYPFGEVPPLPPGPVSQYLESITTQLLEPIDRPSAETIRVTDVVGGISSPLQALFVRGQLSF
jgi:hypothetical protein